MNSDVRQRIVALNPADLDAIRTWAASNPVIHRVWVFGSRVRGTERPDSDLDVAVEHGALPGDSGPFTTWISEAERWRKVLNASLSVPLDLQSYIRGESHTIQAGLDESSVLVYERAV